MATTNPVSQVLVTSGNAALLAAGARPNTLAVGQLGVFNFHTGLSVDGSVATDCRDIYLAVGVDPGAVGSIQDIKTSAGQVIQNRNVKALTYRGTVADIAKVVDIMGITARCEEDYVVKIEIRNGQVYIESGFNQFTKSYNARTGCCADACEDCGTGDPNEIAEQIVNQINADPDGMLTASYVVNKITATVAAGPTATADAVITIGTTAYTVPVTTGDTVTIAAGKIVTKISTQTGSPYRATNAAGVISIYPVTSVSGSTETLVYTTPVTGMTITPIVAATKTSIAAGAAFDTFQSTYVGAGAGIRITGVPMAINGYNGSINLKYVKNRNIDFIVSLPVGFECSGTVTVVTEAANSEGSGYDIRQLEYMSGGTNGQPGPYRTSAVHGLERNGGTIYYATPGANYNTVILAYDQASVGGWLEYLNNLETIIAVPCADTVTTTSIGAFFALIFTQFGTFADDIAANDGCTNVATTTLVAATDGIESLS